MKILLVEDDEGTASLLQNTLTDQHYVVDLAMDGQAGLSLMEAFTYDLVLLDVMLPKLDGLKFCRQLRDRGDSTPVMLLTALESSTSKVIGLDAGANDYVVKPFDTNELLARVRALLRRETPVLSSVIEAGNIRLDTNSCRVSCDGQLLHLTGKEYAILELLLHNAHRIYSQKYLLDYLWSSDNIRTENTVRAHVKALRQKLNKAGAEGFIETVYGLGYRFKLGLDEVKNQAAAKVHPTKTTLVRFEPEISSAVTAIWKRFKPKYSNHVTVLEQAITALLAGTLTEELRQQAAREAHLLIGSLASFGFAEGELLCREIEQIFGDGVKLRNAQVKHLYQLTTALRQELERPIAIKLPVLKLRSDMVQAKILVVDDDSKMLNILHALLEPWGFKVTLLDNPQQFWSTMEVSKPDLLILDMEMPDMSGIHLCELVRNHPHWSDLPVLFLSVHRNAETVNRVFAAGADDYVSKPIMAPELIARVLNRLEHIIISK
ncbi:MAG: response regulator [Rhizonema sp. PD38]|nr:response regulator [Rhizonema sp. PD38]